MFFKNMHYNLEITHPSDRRILKKIIEPDKGSKSSSGNCNFRLKKADGKYYWFVIEYYYSSDDKLTYGFAKEITEVKNKDIEIIKLKQKINEKNILIKKYKKIINKLESCNKNI